METGTLLSPLNVLDFNAVDNQPLMGFKQEWQDLTYTFTRSLHK